jgi:uncharacterized protein YgiM (DUF1202 family)
LSAVVLVDRLNVRSAPNIDAERVDRVTLDMIVTVLAQAGNCAWYQIVTPTGLTGWVASGAEFGEEYLQLDGVCADIPPTPAVPPPRVCWRQS